MNPLYFVQVLPPSPLARRRARRGRHMLAAAIGAAAALALLYLMHVN